MSCFTVVWLIVFSVFCTSSIDAYHRQISSDTNSDDKEDISVEGITIEGDLLIGGLFPIHQQDTSGNCSEKIFIDGVLALEAFLHSLDLVNDILAKEYGFRLGAIALDTCTSDRVALFNALKFVIGDYLKTKGRRKTEPQVVNAQSTDYADYFWSSVANAIFPQNETKPNMGANGGDLDVIGVVGPWGSSVTLQVANLLSLFRMPQISYAATTTTLDNRRTYPYFMRTVPSDSNQAKVLVEILKAYNWTYIIGAYEDSNYGNQGFHAFEKMVETSDICFADRWKINVDHLDRSGRELRRKLRRLAESATEARAFVLYMHSNLFEMIIRAAKQENLENRFVWIGADAWGNQLIPKDLSPAVEGAIVSLPIQKDFKTFAKYFYDLRPNTNSRNIWFKEFWRTLFDCSSQELEECWKRGRVKSVIRRSKFGSLHNVRDAVFAFATALQRMHDRWCTGGRRGVCQRMRQRLADPDRVELLKFLKNVTFPGIDGGEIFFLDGHDGVPNYTIMNYQKNDSDYEWVNIGVVKADVGDSIDQPEQFRFDRNAEARFKSIVSPKYPASSCGRLCPQGHVRHYYQNKCCWTCEPCAFPKYRVNESLCDVCPTVDEDSPSPTYYKPSSTLDSCVEIEPDFYHYFDNPVVSIVAVASSFGLLMTLSTLGLFIYYAPTPIIKASGRELSIALLSGIALCYSTVFVVASPPNPYTCALSRFFNSTGYTICYGSVFIKTNRIARIFRPGNVYASFRRSSYRPSAKRSSVGPGSVKRMRYISPLSQVLFVLGLVGFQTIINIIWLILRPPTPSSKLHIDYERRKISLFKFCRAFENEDMVIALLFPVTLLLFASFYAFKTRKCPGKFNEMKYIVITTYTTCIVWLAFIPVFFATEQLNLRIYAMCASLCINATVTLVCMFAPKLFVAVYRPQKNTKDAVMGKKERAASAPPSPNAYSTASPYENYHNHHHPNNSSSFQLNCPSTRSSMVSALAFEGCVGGISESATMESDSYYNRKPLLQQADAATSRRVSDESTRKTTLDHLTVPKPRYSNVGGEQDDGMNGRHSARSVLLVPGRPVFCGGSACACGKEEQTVSKRKGRRTSV